MSCWHSAGEDGGSGGGGPLDPSPCAARPRPPTHLGKPFSGRKGGRAESPRPARRGCPRTPCHRAARPETTRWPTARGSGDSGSTPAGCTPACLGNTGALGGTAQASAPHGAGTKHKHQPLSSQLTDSEARARRGSQPRNLARHHPGKTPRAWPPQGWRGWGRSQSHGRRLGFHNKQM